MTALTQAAARGLTHSQAVALLAENIRVLSAEERRLIATARIVRVTDPAAVGGYLWTAAEVRLWRVRYEAGLAELSRAAELETT